MIQFECGKCGRRIHANDEYAGRNAACPACGQTLVIPQALAAAGAGGGADGSIPPPLPPISNMPPEMMPIPPGPVPGYTGQATAALVLGIAAILLPGLGLICGALGIVFGILAMQKKRVGKGMAVAGLVLAIAGVGLQLSLVVIIFGAAGKPRELARQAACQANLSAIGKSVIMYSAMSSDQYPFPMIAQYGDPNSAPGPSNHVNGDLEIFSGRLGQCGMQNVWPLIKENLVGVDAFHCPSDGGWTRRSEVDKYGWTDLRQFSYGVHWPYDGSTAAPADQNPARLSDPNGSPCLVIFTDRNPQTASGTFPAPSNHSRDGEAYLRRDSSVSFYKSAGSAGNFNCGYSGDDIYANSAGVPGGIPCDLPGKKGSGATDTSIVPVPSR